MKFKKILSIALSLIMAASCASSALATTEDTITNFNEYEKMLASTTAENNYGLEETVDEGKILQAWNWSFENITANLKTVAEQGFTTIQVSPPNEIKMPTKGFTVCTEDNSNGWWMFYQPAGFQLNESTDNALGTKAEFVKMCEEANKIGVKILVDAVINHMGTDDDHADEIYDNTSTNPMDHVNPRAAEFEQEILAAEAFHSPWIDCTYIENLGQTMPKYDETGAPLLNDNGKQKYGGSATVADITNSITRHCTSGLPDLDTSQQVVQDAIYDYLEELILAGASGFRIDAAKHIETSEDLEEYKSDFWEDTLIKLRENYPDKEIYAYGEILNKCGDGRPFSMYTKLMDVTDSSAYWSIKDAVVNGGTNGNSVPAYPSYEDSSLYGENYVKFTTQNVIQWNESHDTYIDGSTSSLSVEHRDKIWALTAARKEITGVYFARPDDATGNSREEIEAICTNILMGEARISSWANTAVKAVNQFDNYFGDADEALSVQNKMTLIERGGLGATIVNLGGTTGDAKIWATTLADGEYTDAITGNTFNVTEGVLTGAIGSTGIAVIYYSEDTEPVFPQPLDIANDGYPVRDGYYTVVFTDSDNWGSVNVYAWNKSTDEASVSWPGSAMMFGMTNEYNQSQYYAYVPIDCDMVIFNNGSVQSVDTPLSGDTAFYPNGKNSSGKYKLGQFEANFDRPECTTHTTEDWVVTKNATCTEAGEKVKNCKLCGNTVETETIEPTGHTEVVDNAVEPSCTETGLTEGTHCSVCKEVIVAQTAVEAIGHTEKTINTKKATYFANGYTGDKVCETCNTTIEQGKDIAKLKLKVPTVKYTGGKKKITVKYTKVKGATGFQVKYKLGKKAVTKTFKAKKTVKKVIKNLKKGNYKVQVRAFVKSGNKTAYSNWTKAKKVKVK